MPTPPTYTQTHHVSHVLPAQFRGASGARMAGNEALGEGKLEEAGDQYSNAAEALDRLFAPTDTQPRLKEAGGALAATVLSNLALVRGRQGRHSDVVVAATAALGRAPGHAKALFRRAKAHLVRATRGAGCLLRLHLPPLTHRRP